MARRNREPEEAIGPALDGLEEIETLKEVAEMGKTPQDPLHIHLPMPLEEAEEEESLAPVGEEERSVVLLFGSGKTCEAVAALAASSGFDVEIAVTGEDPDQDLKFPEARMMHETPDFLDIVDQCAIDRNFYICIFVEDEEECETILSQCLASHASYIGLSGSRESRSGIFVRLRENGAPDAELAAISCPMGLNIGAESPDQEAVAVVAELLAARAGTINRLRYDD